MQLKVPEFLLLLNNKNEDSGNKNCYKKEEWEERHKNT